MKTYTNKFLAVCIIMITAYISPAQNYTNDAEFIRQVKEYTLNADGSMEYHYYQKLKLLTYFSFHRLYGETFIIFNPEMQKLKINYCRTTMADGKVIEAPANAFNEVLPGFAQNAPYFNHLREMVVTHTGLEKNAVIELDYTITTKAGYYPALMGSEIISEYSPLQDCQLIVNVPPGKKLNYKVYNIRTAPEINEKDGSTEFRFRFGNIKEQSHESYQPKYMAHLPKVVFSTDSWEAMYAWLTGQDAFTYKISEAMKEAVQAKVAGCTDDLQKVFKLQEVVVNTINLVNIPFAHAGFKTRTGIDSWNGNYATEIEKCLLLAGMLQAAGINAEPLAVVAGNQYDANVGCISQVEQFLVRVNPRETKQLFISATKVNDQNLYYDLDGSTLIPLIPDKPLYPEVAGPVENFIDFAAELSLTDTLSLSGNVKLMMGCKPNPYYESLRDINKSKSWLGGLIGQQDVKEVKNINNQQERSTYEFDILKKSKIKSKGDYLTLDLPFMNKGIRGWGMNILNSAREYNFQVPCAIEEKNSITIKIPQGFKLLNATSETKGDFAWGSYAISIRQEGNSIIVEKNARILRSVIPQAEFAVFKQFMDNWNQEKLNKIYLKR